MNMKTIIAVVFSMSIFFCWTYVEKFLFPNVHRYKQSRILEKSHKKKNKNVPVDTLSDGDDFIDSKFDQQSLSQKNSPNLTETEGSDSALKSTIVLKSEHIEVHFSQEGGLLVAAFFNNLKFQNKQKQKTLVFDAQKVFFINNKAYKKWNSVKFDIIKQSIDELVLEYQTPDNLRIQKVFKVNDYSIDFHIKILNQSSKKLSFSEGLSLSTPSHLGNVFDLKKNKRFFKFSTFDLRDNQHNIFKKVKKRQIIYNSPFWMAWQNKYYSLIIKPLQKMDRVYLYPGEYFPKVFFQTHPFSLDPQNNYSEQFFIYCGPKDRKVLKKFEYHFEKILSFGLFNKISLLLLLILNFFYSVTGNYGVAIILLTVLIKILLLPLSQKSLKSMKKLQKLQPHMESLRKQHKDNPQKLQMEMMKLYRSQKASPLGGCLPVIAQMPIFLALFWLLQSAFELNGASFLWITDLSAKDSTYILPILMGGSMFLQQMTSPSMVDSKQKKMMMFLPLIMTFLFVNFPAGLVLYWFVNNLISTLYQKLSK